MKTSNFIRQIIDRDIANNKHNGRVVTRFPPEPNGYLHIGHAKSICLNFGIAEDYNGMCNFRFDDTNPSKENIDYVNSIINDVQWLGYAKDGNILHASDYFDQLYEFAVELIENGKAYVDSLSPDEIREYRGTLTEPGRNSPYRDRSIEENIDLFTRMKYGEFPENTHVLRAKIDMSSGNINMRDPVLYRIKHESHPIAGDKWCIYPLYDFAHSLSDAIEGVTHSLCTMEFEDHRPLYDWCVENVSAPSRPEQTEFSRLSLEYTVLSKRWLTKLVEDELVAGWDDPRMPTLSGLRNRGYTPASILDFCERVGITKNFNEVEMSVLENCIREDLDYSAPRLMAVLDPLPVTIENYPEDEVEWLSAQNHPKRPELGNRKVPFSKRIFVERSDFLEDPPRKFFRLAPGAEVRLRYAYLVTCTEVIKDQDGNVVELRCRYDPESRGGFAPDGRRVRGTIHWVSQANAMESEVNLYDRLFTVPNPAATKNADFADLINPESLKVVNAMIEPQIESATPETRYQFERSGYFVLASQNGANGKPVFHRTVTLRDSWTKRN
ncbi:MAG: glutamine--tRNA ligase/YqeY domain fusion protein [Gammaproteobacteria bacterium]|nr:glutamine--tRNA ligase/YqeY domain fusion protein [Gammaproteobacteria bacterium]